jgi:hypothetical protein
LFVVIVIIDSSDTVHIIQVILFNFNFLANLDMKFFLPLAKLGQEFIIQRNNFRSFHESPWTIRVKQPRCPFGQTTFGFLQQHFLFFFLQ